MIKKGDIIKLQIVDYAFGGKGIGKIQLDNKNYIIFVQHAIIGQIILVKITKKKPSYSEGIIQKVIVKSNLEIESPYQTISGAPYMNLPILEQKKMKIGVTHNLFEKVGKLKNSNKYFDEWIDSPSSHHYRNKMEYSFSSIGYDFYKEEVVDDTFSLGFKRKGTWWIVENLNKDSGLFDQKLESNLFKIRNYLQKTGLKAWHTPKKTGFFRHLVVRKSFSDNQLLLNLVTSSKNIHQFNSLKFGDFLKDILGPKLAGLIHTINDDVADREKLNNGKSKLIVGKDSIFENINTLKFEISMQSFFQTNPKCAEKLYQKVIDYILEYQIDKEHIILDLFCGTGTIGQLISKYTSNNIIGVDIIESAIKNAIKNASLNKLDRLKFINADVGKFLFNHPEYQNKIHTIVLDPPRAGIAPKSLRKVTRLNAKVIVYVSCNPATQARDLVTLNEMGYQLKKFSLVDQFPHTSHIESIMLFEKNQ